MNFLSTFSTWFHLKLDESNENIKINHEKQYLEFYQNFQKDKKFAFSMIQSNRFLGSISQVEYEKLKQQIDKAIEKSEERITAKEIISIMKQASETLKNAQYNIRLSGDKATNIVDNRGISTPLTKEEELRIAEEMGLIHGSNKSKQEESIPEE